MEEESKKESKEESINMNPREKQIAAAVEKKFKIDFDIWYPIFQQYENEYNIKGSNKKLINDELSSAMQEKGISEKEWDIFFKQWFNREIEDKKNVANASFYICTICKEYNPGESKSISHIIPKSLESKSAPRYDSNIPNSYVRSEKNAIFTCKTCAAKIDDEIEGKKYTKESLEEEKYYHQKQLGELFEKLNGFYEYFKDTNIDMNELYKNLTKFYKHFKESDMNMDELCERFDKFNTNFKETDIKLDDLCIHKNRIMEMINVSDLTFLNFKRYFVSYIKGHETFVDLKNHVEKYLLDCQVNEIYIDNRNRYTEIVNICSSKKIIPDVEYHQMKDDLDTFKSIKDNIKDDEKIMKKLMDKQIVEQNKIINSHMSQTERVKLDSDKSKCEPFEKNYMAFVDLMGHINNTYTGIDFSRDIEEIFNSIFTNNIKDDFKKCFEIRRCLNIYIKSNPV